MSQSKPTAPRFVILFWTVHSFANAQQRTVRFQPFSST